MSGDVERSAADTSSVGASPATVLVAADTAADADTFAHWLDDRYDVEVAHGGREAIERLSPAIDVAVLDRRMSGLPGDAVLAEIRDRDLDCRVVFRTVAEPTAVEERAYDGFVVSPVDRDALVAAVDAQADGRVEANGGGRFDGGLDGGGSAASRAPVTGGDGTVPGDGRRAPPREGNRGVDAMVREVGRALADAGTREELERAVCERLTDLDSYRRVWVGRCTATTDRLTLQEACGFEVETPTTLEAMPDAAAETAASGEISVGTFEPDEAGGALDEALREADAAGGPLASVPLVHGDAMYGLVAVHAPGGFDEAEVAALADLGALLAYGISAVERRKLLVADTAVELELAVEDRVEPLVDLAADRDCALALDGLVPTDDGAALCYVDAEGVDPDALLADTRERFADARAIETRADGGTVEIHLTDACLLLTLLSSGAVVREFSVREGTATVAAEVAPDADVRAVVEAVQSAFDGVALVAQRMVTPSVASGSQFRSALAASLTDQQRAAIEAAYAADYFEWPRGTTAEELAESMGIASPTLHQHLRAAKRKLLEAYFDESGGPPRTDPA